MSSQAEGHRAVTPSGTVALWVIAGLMVLAALHVGRAVFVPMTVALLLSVVLMPLGQALQRVGLPRPVAVGLLLLLALGVIGGVLLLVVSQLLTMLAELPNWELTLRSRLQAVSDGSWALERSFGTIRRLAEELAPAAAQPSGSVVVAAPSDGGGALRALLDMAALIAGSAASLGVALLLMAYLLMQREGVRDRFLRLAGMKDIHRSTRALADATERVSRCLLLQTLMNATYGLAIGLGTAAIGVPNAPLWGVLAFVLRFVPFLGSCIALSLPLTVAFATAPDWTAPLLVIALFATVSFVLSQLMEPLLYGRTAGVSPLALLVSSALWTVLWGPVGLLLAPPVTACLAILGRHVPALGFLEILLGNGEVLPAPLRFYQRFLADDPDGAEEIAELHADLHDASTALRELVMPAIAALAADQADGVVGAAAARRTAGGLAAISASLVADEPLAEDAPRIRTIPVAGAADQALAACTAAIARLRGWRLAAEGETPTLAVICLARQVSELRLRRAIAEASRARAEVIGFAPEERGALQLVAAIRPTPVLRGPDALAARLLQRPAARVNVAAEAPEAAAPTALLGLPG